jgi:hypothetical protein
MLEANAGMVEINFRLTGLETNPTTPSDTAGDMQRDGTVASPIVTSSRKTPTD